MTVRSTMAELIVQVRALAAVASADTTIEGETYWSDQMVQDYLDRTQEVEYLREMEPVPKYNAGSWEYYLYRVPCAGQLARTITVRDNAGSAVGTALYSVNYEAKTVTFTSDQASNTLKYADIEKYNVNEAAAQIWDAKAAMVAERYDFKIDNQDIKASQQYHNCIMQARKLRTLGGGGSRMTQWVRTDEV